jgi:hypothetical protein
MGIRGGRVEQSKPAPFDSPNPKGMRHPKTFQLVKPAPPAREIARVKGPPSKTRVAHAKSSR